MSSEIGIQAKNVGKRYEQYKSPFTQLLGNVTGACGEKSDWALHGVSFNVRKGECIGLLGENGAGKSTLLQVLTGTTYATEGGLQVEGRIAAMLELGAGFNPNFTGIENARLGATLQGLNKQQIEQRLPSIVEFAGIGDFVNRPTREYSSGMFARLAFAVCAHVDADILIVDEILAVGDIAFQQKTMHFLRQFCEKGVVFFASHDLAAVGSLCNRAILLDQGQIVSDGLPKQVIHDYMRLLSSHSNTADDFHDEGQLSAFEVASVAEMPPNNATPFFDFTVPEKTSRPGSLVGGAFTCKGMEVRVLAGGENVKLAIDFDGKNDDLRLAIAIRNRLGEVICYRDTGDLGENAAMVGARRAVFEFYLPFLFSGSYSIDAALFQPSEADYEAIDIITSVATFEIMSQHIGGGSANAPLISASIEVFA